MLKINIENCVFGDSMGLKVELVQTHNAGMGVNVLDYAEESVKDAMKIVADWVELTNGLTIVDNL